MEVKLKVTLKITYFYHTTEVQKALSWLSCSFLIFILLVTSWSPGHQASHNHIKKQKSWGWESGRNFSFFSSFPEIPRRLPLLPQARTEVVREAENASTWYFLRCCGRQFCQPGRQGKGSWPWEGSQQCLLWGLIAVVTACILLVSNGQ